MPRSARLFLTVLVLCVVAGSPAAAIAGQPATVAPPGDSAVSQYVEDVPTVSGPLPTSATAAGRAPDARRLPSGPARALGGRNQAAGDLAAALGTAPAGRSGTVPSAPTGRVSVRAPRSSAVGPSPRRGQRIVSAIPPATVRSPGSLVAAAAGAGNGSLALSVAVISLAAAVAIRVRGRRRQP